MTHWQFVKIKTVLGESLVMSETGELPKPVAILDENAINRLNKEWKEKKTYV